MSLRFGILLAFASAMFAQESIAPVNLPQAIVGSQYFAQFTASPGSTPQWALASGALPPGLSLDTVTGRISGSPTSAGVYTFQLSATQAPFGTGFQTFTIVVSLGPLQIIETSIPTAIQNSSYTTTLTASGGIPPYQWSFPPGPNIGLTIGVSNGVISGTPSVLGSQTVSVTLTDSYGNTVNRGFALFVAGALNILTASLPNGTAGSPYSQTLTAGGGQAPYTWSINGALPPGLQLEPATGRIFGTPTTNGTYPFTVQLSDFGRRTASKQFSITIGAALSITTTSLPSAAPAISYSQTLAASGGQAPYMWSIVSGSIAPLALNASTGVISGTPSAAVTLSFTVQVTDALGASAQKALTIEVASQLTITTNTFPDGTTGSAYSHTLIATGGQSPYTWSMQGGPLPDGLQLESGTGKITGTPSRAGTFPLIVQVADAASLSVRVNRTVLVVDPLAITSSNFTATLGATFSQRLVATGGTSPYTWSIASGRMPDGLQLDASGLMSGSPTSLALGNPTVVVTDAQNRTARRAISFVLLTATLPAVTINGPASSGPAQQPAISITLASAYPADVTGTLTLTFASSVGGDDQMIRFSNGTRTANFTIAAGSTQASFGGASSIAVLTGTVAGTITLTASFSSAGTDVTPSPAPSRSITTTANVPFIQTVSLVQGTGGFNVVVTGFSTTREMISGLFHFAPATNSTVATPDVTVQLGPAFSAWYSNSASNATGSLFTLTVPFTVTNGNPGSIVAVTVTLTNTRGASNPASPQ